MQTKCKVIIRDFIGIFISFVFQKSKNNEISDNYIDSVSAAWMQI